MEMESETRPSATTTTTTTRKGRKGDDFEHIDREGEPVVVQDDESTSSGTISQESNEKPSHLLPLQQTNSNNNNNTFESKLIAKTGENIDKKVKQGLDSVGKKIQSLSTKENVTALQKKLQALWDSFLQPARGAKKDVAIYGVPPVAVELLTWYRPKVTAVVCLLSFLLYGLVLMDEYTVLGLVSTIAYMVLFAVVVLRNILPFVGREPKAFVILPKDLIEKYAKECADSTVVMSNAIAAVVNCDDFTNTLSALFSIYCFSVVANNISGLFLIFAFLVSAFSLPYVYVMKKKEFDDFVRSIRSFVQKTLTKVYDAIPKANLKDQ